MKKTKIGEYKVPRCRICGAIESQQFVRAPFVSGGREEHNFWQCHDCDAIYLHPVPSLEEERQFYVKEFENFMSTRVGDHRDWSNAERHKNTNQDQVKRRLPFLKDYLSPGSELLEIGCSSGFMLDAFRDGFGVKCVGVEPSGEFKEFVEMSGHTVVGDLSEVSDCKFDIITHFFVLEHIRDPFVFLKESYSLLKEGGVIIAEVPCAHDVLTTLYKIDAFDRFYWSIAHHYYYTKKSLSYVLGQLGCRYELVPEQRYDLSNHMIWMRDGKPGGQGRFNEQLGERVMSEYHKHLIDTWQCDTMFMYVWK